MEDSRREVGRKGRDGGGGRMRNSFYIFVVVLPLLTPRYVHHLSGCLSLDYERFSKESNPESKPWPLWFFFLRCSPSALPPTCPPLLRSLHTSVPFSFLTLPINLEARGRKERERKGGLGHVDLGERVRSLHPYARTYYSSIHFLHPFLSFSPNQMSSLLNKLTKKSSTKVSIEYPFAQSSGLFSF